MGAAGGGHPAPVPAGVGWVSCVGEKGGAETLMIECLRVLDRSRFRPVVIQLRPGPLQADLEAIGVPVHVLHRHRMREVHRVAGAIAGVARVVVRERLSLLHSNGFRAHVYGGLAAAAAGVPEVWTTHTVEQPGWATRAILSIPTDRVLANCPRTEGYFRRQGLRVTMLWPPVNPGHLAAAAARAPRRVLADRYGLPPDAEWVSIAARLQPYKGHAHFLRALAGLSDGRRIHGVVIGGSLFGQDTGFVDELRRQAGASGLAGRVTFTGYVPDDDLAGLLAASAVLVHPALEEDFGLSVAEAQSLGVPVVAYAAVGPAAIVEEGETGWLVPVGDESGLAATLGRVLEDSAGRARIGVRAAVRAAARFGAEKHASDTAAVYDRVLSDSGRRIPGCCPT